MRNREFIHEVMEIKESCERILEMDRRENESITHNAYDVHLAKTCPQCNRPTNGIRCDWCNNPSN